MKSFLLWLVFVVAACGDNRVPEIEVSPGAVAVPIGASATVEVNQIGRVRIGLAALTWEVEDPAIAASRWRDGQLIVTGRALGKTRAIGSYYGQEVSVDIEVVDAMVTSLRLDQAAMSVPTGMVIGLEAVATYSDGTERDVTREAEWALDAAIASISVADATLRGDQVGSTLGHVRFGGQEATFSLTVTDAQLLSLEVDPPVATLPVGVSLDVVAIGQFSDGTALDVSASVQWASSAAAATVSAGTVHAAVVGDAVITAQLAGKQAAATIHVTSATVQSLSISPSSVKVPIGTARQLVATATYSDGLSFDVTPSAAWAAPGLAATVSQDGRVVGVLVGQADVSASFEGLTAHASVEVTAALLIGLQISPNTVALPKGTQTVVTATALWSDGTSSDVTQTVDWETTAPSIATVSGGQIAGVAAGTATITATFGLAFATVAVTVNGAAIGSIAIEPQAPSIAAGTQLQLTAIGTYSDNSTLDVTGLVAWSSSHPLVAAVSNAPGSRGKLHGLLAGTTTITATLDGASTSIVVTVTAATILAIHVEPSVLVMASGLSVAATAKATFSDGTTQDITTQATWGSTVPGFASVSPSGLVSAHSIGATVVSARIGAISGVLAVTVTGAVLQQLEISPTTVSLPAGTGSSLTATGVFSDGSHADLSANVTWVSSTPAVASVTNGLGGGVVHANQAGSSTITATLGATSATAQVEVGTATLVSIEVIGGPGVLPLGLAHQLAAFGTYSDGTVLDVTALATWDATGAAVLVSNADSSRGRITAIGLGQSTVSASIGAISGELVIQTSLATLLSITVSSTPPIPLATSAQLTATGQLSDGSSVDLTAQAGWSSNVPGTLSVSAGLVTAHAPGAATIEARVGLIAGSATVESSAATLSSIVITPPSASLAAGIVVSLTATGHYSDSSTLDLTGQVIWSSSTTAATVSMVPAGRVVAVTPGATEITARMGAITETATITVTAAVLQAISIEGPSAALQLGQITALTATAHFSDNSTLEITTQATWAASGSIAVSNATPGRATAIALGTSDVTATFSGITGTRAVAVAAGGCHVVINEVKTGGLLLSQDEFVELFNPCSFEVDLSRARLSYRIAAGLIDVTLLDLGGSLPAGGYRLYGGESFVGISDGSFAIDLAQLGGSVVLRYAGTRVDSLGWGAGLGDLIEGVVALVIPSTKSLARIPNGHDTDNNGADFVVGNPTPRAANQ
jgi:hypothetical protein